MTSQNVQRSKKLLRFIEYGGLVIITISTLVAGLQEIFTMVTAGRVTLADLLLLFIYLEIIAMVAAYLDTGKLPVRMPLYIAIIALARYMALEIKEIDSWGIIAIAGAVLTLAIAVFVIRYGELRFPYPHSRNDDTDTKSTK
jgi:protein PsiE